MMQRSETVPAGGATSARVEIGMAVGELRISGGATELMDADFTYDDELEPEVEYRVDGGQGVLTVKQGSKKNVRSTQNEWNIRLNDRIPIDLQVNVAAAAAELVLDTLPILSLDIHSASGAVLANVGGNQPWVDRIKIESASGGIQIRLNGTYRSLSRLESRSASGKLDIDLSGSWKKDLEAHINAVSGAVTVTVPTRVGVAAQTSTISGRLNSPTGRTSGIAGKAYVNDLFESSRVKLKLRIATVSGSITIGEGS
ncbi:MAG: hypothetical protein H0V47_01930 [Chloroflexia bacterium]|nr:hypothetical protein [Chloroflexia bacterium]